MRIRLLLAFVALSGFAALTLAAPVPRYRAPKVPDATSQLKQLQGLWERSLSTTRLGVGQPAVILSRSTTNVRIDGDRWSYVRNLNGEERVTTSYKIKLDTSKKPMWIDLIRETTGQPTLQGILSIEGNTVRFCYSPASSTRTGHPRPVTFEVNTEGDNRQLLMILKRAGLP